jgi:hypothetical protein
LRRNFGSLLFDHLKKEKIGQLLDVIAIIDPIVTQSVTESPEFTNDVGHKSSFPPLTHTLSRQGRGKRKASPSRGRKLSGTSPYGGRQGPKIPAVYDVRKLPRRPPGAKIE